MNKRFERGRCSTNGVHTKTCPSWLCVLAEQGWVRSHCRNNISMGDNEACQFTRRLHSSYGSLELEERTEVRRWEGAEDKRKRKG